MPTRYALVDFDSEGNVNNVYGDIYIDGTTDNMVLEALSGNLIEIANTVDLRGNDLQNVANIDATNATHTSVTADTGDFQGSTVANTPQNNTDVTRKTDLDTVESDLNTSITGVDDDLQSHKTDFNDHSARHSEGGADEIEASDLSGSNGTDGQYLQTDGTSASWGSLGSSGGGFYGDTEDGDITDTTDITRGGVIRADTYTLDAGVTVSVDGALIIFAKNSLQIDGVIDASGEGSSGGVGGRYGGGVPDEPDPGNNGILSPIGTGGAGGNSYQGQYSDTVDGATGGDGDTTEIPKQHRSATGIGDLYFLDDLNHPTLGIGAGGGGGAPPDYAGGMESTNGGDGSSPGGGGGGSTDGSDPESNELFGGDGGEGGGLIYLCSPELTINGTVIAEGIDGEDGDAGNSIGAGGGGGGSGGVIILRGETVSTVNGTLSASGGLGGAGGVGGNTTGGDGGDGADGLVSIISST